MSWKCQQFKTNEKVIRSTGIEPVAIWFLLPYWIQYNHPLQSNALPTELWPDWMTLQWNYNISKQTTPFLPLGFTYIQSRHWLTFGINQINATLKALHSLIASSHDYHTKKTMHHKHRDNVYIYMQFWNVSIASLAEDALRNVSTLPIIPKNGTNTCTKSNHVTIERCGGIVGHMIPYRKTILDVAELNLRLLCPIKSCVVE